MPGLEETLGLLLDMAVAVHSRCAASTAALLDMLDTGAPFRQPLIYASRCLPVGLNVLFGLRCSGLKPVQHPRPEGTVMATAQHLAMLLLTCSWSGRSP